MRVAIFGATGFVGNYLVRALLAAGHELSVLVRPGSESKLVEPDQCRTTSGDIGSEQAIRTTLDGCEAVIYNIGLLKEFPRRGITFEEAHFAGVKRVVEAAQDLGVKRFLLMSANGVKSPGTPYQETKFRAEQLLRSSDTDWTIFQPSVIFGDSAGRQEFSHQLYTELVKPPVPAVAFPGVAMSPVFIGDVVDAFVKALSDPDTIGKTYPLGGPEVLSWEAMVRRVAAGAATRINPQRWCPQRGRGPRQVVRNDAARTDENRRNVLRLAAVLSRDARPAHDARGRQYGGPGDPRVVDGKACSRVRHRAPRLPGKACRLTSGRERQVYLT